MKKIISYIIAITLPAIFFTLNTAGAGDRDRIFELAESGHSIEFSEARTDMELADSVIARDPADNASTRIQ